MKKAVLLKLLAVIALVSGLLLGSFGCSFTPPAEGDGSDISPENSSNVISESPEGSAVETSVGAENTSVGGEEISGAVIDTDPPITEPPVTEPPAETTSFDSLSFDEQKLLIKQRLVEIISGDSLISIINTLGLEALSGDFYLSGVKQNGSDLDLKALGSRGDVYCTVANTGDIYYTYYLDGYRFQIVGYPGALSVAAADKLGATEKAGKGLLNFLGVDLPTLFSSSSEKIDGIPSPELTADDIVIDDWKYYASKAYSDRLGEYVGASQGLNGADLKEFVKSFSAEVNYDSVKYILTISQKYTLPGDKTANSFKCTVDFGRGGLCISDIKYITVRADIRSDYGELSVPVNLQMKMSGIEFDGQRIAAANGELDLKSASKVTVDGEECEVLLSGNYVVDIERSKKTTGASNYELTAVVINSVTRGGKTEAAVSDAYVNAAARSDGKHALAYFLSVNGVSVQSVEGELDLGYTGFPDVEDEANRIAKKYIKTMGQT